LPFLGKVKNDPVTLNKITKVYFNTKNNKVFISTTYIIENLNSKIFLKKYNKFETKNPEDIYQFKPIKYGKSRIHKTNKINNKNINNSHSNIKTSNLQHKYYKVILNTIQKIHMKKINIILNKNPTKIQITKIQTLTKTKTLTNHDKSNNQTKKNYTKHHQRMLYTPTKERLTTLMSNQTASASRPRHKTLNKYKIANN